MEERILYNLRLNKKLFIALPVIEEFTVYTKKLAIPCWKLTVFNYYKAKNEPFSVVLIPRRNITTQEAHILSVLRDDEQYIREDGFKLLSVVDGIANIEYLEKLTIYKKYALKSKNDNANYLDLLDKTITYESI